MAANMADVAQSWVMRPDGHFDRATWDEGEFAFNCHRFFMENPSLSLRITVVLRRVITRRVVSSRSTLSTAALYAT